jgi:2-haloalkanoic acid dehalogenase type II
LAQREVEPVEDAEGMDAISGGRPYQAVLVDLFGTLIDFRTVFVDTLARILADNDLVSRRQEFQTRWQSFVFQGQYEGEFITVRQDFERSLVAVLDHLGKDGDLGAYAQNVIGDMFERLRMADLFPETPKAIARLENEGVPWAIVSNVDEEDLRAIVANQGLRPAVTVSSERVASYKPDGEIFQTALGELGVPPTGALHVGDSPVADVMGATRQGIATLWVNRYGAQFPEDLPSPRWEMPDLSELPSLML